MLTSLSIIIVLSVFLVIYTYVLYPVFLQLLAKTFGNKRSSSYETITGALPVAIICAMYNEEDVAEEKIANFKALTYPYIRLYIGSDGSSDSTNTILSKYAADPSISIFTFPRRGKVHVINDLITATTEDIIVFTDANSMYVPDAVDHLVKAFSDPTIGAVCGCLKLIERDGSSGESFYWCFETMLKKAESVFKCVVGGNGAIYAVRRQLAHTLPPDTINDDFTISMRVIQHGYGMTYSEYAIATEEVAKDDQSEFKRHIRDAAGHYRAMRHLQPLLNPFYPKRFFFYVSHRVIRWFVPHLMVLLIVLPWFCLHQLIPLIILVLEGGFYLLAMFGWLSKSKLKLVYIPFYFSYINTAIFVGFIKNMLGIQKVMWDRTQRT